MVKLGIKPSISLGSKSKQIRRAYEVNAPVFFGDGLWHQRQFGKETRENVLVGSTPVLPGWAAHTWSVSWDAL